MRVCLSVMTVIPHEQRSKSLLLAHVASKVSDLICNYAYLSLHRKFLWALPAKPVGTLLNMHVPATRFVLECGMQLAEMETNNF